MKQPINKVTQTAKKRPLLVTALIFVAYLLPLLLFIGLADEVRDGEVLFFDKPFMLYVHSLSSVGLTQFFEAVTQLGGVVFVPILTAVLAAILWWRTRRKKPVLFLLSAVGGAAILNVIFKTMFQRTRPDFWEHLVQEHSYSFPSGHAMASSALALALIILCWRTRWRWLILIGGAIYMIIIGLSRIYLGVHYPSDILAGWCVSLVWVLLLAGLVYEYMVRYSYKRKKEKS